VPSSLKLSRTRETGKLSGIGNVTMPSVTNSQLRQTINFALGLRPVIEFVAGIASATFKDLVGAASDEFRHTLLRCSDRN